MSFVQTIRCSNSLCKLASRQRGPLTRWASATPTTRLMPTLRCLSTQNQNLELSVDQSTGIATLKMMKRPVNSMNLEFLTEFNIALEKFENNKDVNGLIITSGVPKVFCAGVDIAELYQAKKDRITEFWRTLQTLWLNIYGSRLATVAAINGHSPAGGCLVTIACDYRVMADGKYAIGLNESQLGFPAPYWLINNMVNVIGQRRAERALQLGMMFSPAEALKVGLVDEVVPDADVVEHARQELVRLLKVPGVARELTKDTMRRATIEKLSVRQEAAADDFVQFSLKDSTQRLIGNFLENLNKKKK